MAVAIPREALARRTLRELFWFSALALCSLAIAWVFSLIVEPTTGPTEFPTENGPSELLQAAMVIVAGMLFFLAALRFSFEIFYASLAIAVACWLAAVREFPRCGSEYYDYGPCLSNNTKGLIVLGAIGLAVALMAIRREPLSRHLRELNFFWIVPCALSGAMLVIAEIIGESYYRVWIEETIELASYLNLLVFAGVLNLSPHWFQTLRAPHWKPAAVLKKRRATMTRVRPSSPSDGRRSAASR
ncbi:hypothetical protein GGR03_000081 [Aurantimonas endophytica]|uniref:Uncharacterized protein n=1 Tax=Aurantimonas endophytica TaxID=1522175 RepID=A0A7W6H9C7_9HYPH|nr:hypothetical protein [Aurantimonas endophytica]MBB4001034.1 hypothetical protein [Aurantimonas endophytica]